MTVREHLVFQARLKMKSHIPMAQRMIRVDEVLEELGLLKCADVLIGIPGRIKGISGGEMRRLSFASEVLTDPPLLFCDEPTSGLDSYMAQNVISVLKNMATKGKTITCTIHQPSSQVYSLFDKILLLAEGRTAYLGDAKEALTFFDSLRYKCPANFNPSDFFIETLAIQPGSVDECRQNVKDICDNYEDSDAAIEVARVMQSMERRNSDLFKFKNSMSNQSLYKSSWIKQFIALLDRSWATQIRDPMLLNVRLITTIFVAVLLGIIYLQQDLDQEGIMNINGALFLFMVNMSFQNAISVVNVFCVELPVFLREHWNGMYRADAYFLAKTVAETPAYIVLPIIFNCISYWMVGFNSNAGRFLVSCGIHILTVNIACSFGYMISCLSADLNMALALTNVSIIPFVIFGGFFLNSGSIPGYLVWVKYISWFYYGNEALAVNQWKGIDNIVCNRNTNATCITSGKVLLGTLSFDEDHFSLDICMLFVLLISFRVIAFLALLRKTFRKS